MITYVYTARNQQTGEKVSAEVRAQSESSAAKALMQQGMTPITIIPKDQAGILKSIGGGKVKVKDRILYTRQLATLINAGLPLTQSLRTVGEQTSSERLQVINSEVLSAVEGGSSLAEAYGRYPKNFNTIFVQLIAAGEASGTLDEALERIASQQEKDDAVTKKIRGALVYPAIVILVIFAVLGFLLTGVVPQIAVLYKDLKKELPLATKILVGMSDFFISWWWINVPVVVGIVFGLRTYKNTEGGRFALDKFKMKAPLFGPLFMKLYMARFARTGATLLAAGVPLLEMIRITSQAVNNVHIEASLQKAVAKVKGGKALSDSIEGDDNFLILVPQMIRIGENSGKIDEMMTKTASYYEDELDNQIKTISTIIEPALMVVLALMAGIVVAAVLLPVYGLVGDSLSF